MFFVLYPTVFRNTQSGELIVLPVLSVSDRFISDLFTLVPILDHGQQLFMPKPSSND